MNIEPQLSARAHIPGTNQEVVNIVSCLRSLADSIECGQGPDKITLSADNGKIDVSQLFTSANTSNNAENVRTSAADATPIATVIAGKITNPDGGSVGNVLKKTASGVEWGSGGGGGDLSKYTHVNIPSNNWNVSVPFSGNTVIEEVTGFDGGSLFYSKYMYANCVNLERVKCTGNGNGSAIGEHCFFNCTNLVEVDFGTGTYNGKIGVKAFENCTKLESVVFPEGITGQNDQVFTKAAGLRLSIKNIVFPSTLKTFGSYFVNGGPSNGCDYTFKANVAEITFPNTYTFAYMTFVNSTVRFPNNTMSEVLTAFTADSETGRAWVHFWYTAGRNNTFVCSDGSFTTP